MATVAIGHQGDIGTIFAYVCTEDVSDATLFKLYYIDPANKKGVWEAYLSGTNEIRHLTTIAEHFNLAGVWTLQPWMQGPNWSGWGTEVTVEIKRNIAA